MQYTIDNEKAAALLSEAYRPEGFKTFPKEDHLSILSDLQSLLMDKSAKLGATSEEIGELDYFDNGGELAFRGELLHWRLLSDGLLPEFAAFLAAKAPSHIIILTFDFQDTDERMLECPTIIVFPTEIVGGFELCDLDDTPTMLGFPQASFTDKEPQI